jgi:hypothetical protein
MSWIFFLQKKWFQNCRQRTWRQRDYLRQTGLSWLVYSCCSYLEHRKSVKRFVSLQFLNVKHSVGLLGWVISPSQGRYLTQTQNKHKQTSMPRVGFEHTIPAFERAKTFHAFDRAATVTGIGLSGKIIRNLTVKKLGASPRTEYSWHSMERG